MKPVFHYSIDPTDGGETATLTLEMDPIAMRVPVIESERLEAAARNLLDAWQRSFSAWGEKNSATDTVLPEVGP